MKFIIGISVAALLFVAGCGGDSSPETFEAPPPQKPEIATTTTQVLSLASTTITTTTLPPIRSCIEVAEEFASQRYWEARMEAIEQDSDTRYEFNVISASEINHPIVAEEVRACSVVIEIVAESDNRYIDGDRNQATGIMCVNSETWQWMGELDRRIVEELEDCQILINTIQER